MVRRSVGRGVVRTLVTPDGIGGSEPTTNLDNGAITVPGGWHNDYLFTVKAGVLSPRVSGTFAPSRGSGNDRIVLVLDETNYVNWKNGHHANSFYDCGKWTTQSIIAILQGD
jgi:hypothetical protein